jgi:DNA repair protein RecO (recombination protein O)
MIAKTQGMVLGTTKFQETSIIAQIYTADYGTQSYLVQGVRTGKGKASRMALFQPLSLLELVAYQKETRGVQRLTDAKLLLHYTSIPFDFKKSTIGLFLAEILQKALREEAPNEALFEFLVDSMRYLDTAAAGFENFHLQFLFQCGGWLGFGVETAEEWLEQLQLQGVASQVPPLIDRLLQEPYGTPISLGQQLRSELLYWLVRYYQLHLGGFGEVKSLAVLQEIWR